MGKYTGITSVCAIPSDASHYTPLAKRLPVSEQVVIGTPGTVRSWVMEKKLGTREMKILVFDEADHLLAEVLSLSPPSSLPFLLDYSSLCMDLAPRGLHPESRGGDLAHI